MDPNLKAQKDDAALDLITLRPCSSTNPPRDRGRDRISSLPYDLLSRILSLLPTKDAVSMSVSCKRMMSLVFALTTSFDFDDSPIFHCLDRPHLIKRVPSFKKFVDTVLQASTGHWNQQQPLTRFRLQFGGDKIRFRPDHRHRCSPKCYPDLELDRLNAWVCFPLSRKVRELDLSVHVRKHCELPLGLFACPTLEVLKLDMNLYVDPHSVSMTSFCLPNLKVLQLRSIRVPDNDFVNRVLCGCPSLEDLTLESLWWEDEDVVTISSHSLRRLVLDMTMDTTRLKRNMLDYTESVLIDTPNLQYFRYFDNLACQYHVTSMDALIIAEIVTLYNMDDVVDNCDEVCFQSSLSLVRMCSTVRRLCLNGSYTEALGYGVLKDQLPLFFNLRYLELGCESNTMWDQVLLEFLNCSPFLETLVFSEGLSDTTFTGGWESEAKCWGASQAIPCCCRSHLKRIVIQKFLNSEREVELVKFLLRNALVLEELVVSPNCYTQTGYRTSFETTLKNLPRASINCSIRE